MHIAAFRCPSNIALVKYWGKKGLQLPANASISFTLRDLYTETRVSTSRGDGRAEVYVDGNRTPSFDAKVQAFFDRQKCTMRWMDETDFRVDTRNNFPHSSGIASSASGMGALALCTGELHRQISGEELALSEISSMARLGSGSACRSLHGPLAVWGEHPDYPGSSDAFAVPFPTEELHPAFSDWEDAVLIVESGRKAVSSSAGHKLLDAHPYAAARYATANVNMHKLRKCLTNGDIETFTALVESEALQLHAMMMCSMPYYLLMKPASLEIINRAWEFREQSGVPLVITLDAGANVHVLYPAQFKSQVHGLINSSLVSLCENGLYLCSSIGEGVLQLNQ
jgi:diphosphomevalonate decarboxylase